MSFIMGWIATGIMLYGSFLVGNKSKQGFLLQIVGNALWAVVGATRGPQLDLIIVSLAFVGLYVRNFILWHNQDRR
jgi:hypothetical protein